MTITEFNPNEMTIGEKIKRTRAAVKKTQAQFGELLGVTGNTIARWERGEMTPDSPTILELALRQVEIECGLPKLKYGRELRKRLKQLAQEI